MNSRYQHYSIGIIALVFIIICVFAHIGHHLKEDLSNQCNVRIDEFLHVDPKHVNLNPYAAFNNAAVNFVDLTGKAPRNATEILVERFGDERIQDYTRLDKLLDKGRFGKVFPERFEAYNKYSNHVQRSMECNLPKEISRNFGRQLPMKSRNLVSQMSWDLNNPFESTEQSIKGVKSLKEQSFNRVFSHHDRQQMKKYIEDREIHYWKTSNGTTDIDYYVSPRVGVSNHWSAEEMTELYTNSQFKHVNVIRGYQNLLDTESIVNDFQLNPHLNELQDSQILSYLSRRNHIQLDWQGMDGVPFTTPYLNFIKP